MCGLNEWANYFVSFWPSRLAYEFIVMGYDLIRLFVSSASKCW